MLSLMSLRGASRAADVPVEAVLKPGMEIKFRNESGRGSVSYVSPLQRKFTLMGHVEVMRMIARKERFLGQLGLYNPGARGIYSSDRSPRVVAIEAEMHFKSLGEALAFMIEGSAIMKWVYNEDGYVVGFSSSPQRNQVNVTVYRYFINGVPARSMPGFNNGSVIVGKAPN